MSKRTESVMNEEQKIKTPKYVLSDRDLELLIPDASEMERDLESSASEPEAGPSHNIDTNVAERDLKWSASEPVAGPSHNIDTNVAEKYRLRNEADIHRRLSHFMSYHPRTFDVYSKEEKETIFPLRNSSMPTFVEPRYFQQQLPAYRRQNDVMQMMNQHDVIIVSGDTGSGKSTQIPQYILNECAKSRTECLIFCTQPRKLAAKSVADRVAFERSTQLGDAVGYQVMNDCKVSKNTNLIFMTSGYLTSYLTANKKALKNVTHLVVDEIHERDITSDILLCLLKGILSELPKLKLILMSATVQTEKLASYFENTGAIKISGRMYNVEQLYIEDIINNFPECAKAAECTDCSEDEFNFSVKVALIKALHEQTRHAEGILVFLPGFAAIEILKEKIEAAIATDDYKIFIVHGQMKENGGSRHPVYRKLDPDVRKIVLATNIAETSITIDGMVHCIDSGLVKMSQYDAVLDLKFLAVERISKASAHQRKGRVGRTRPGKCYRMYSRNTFESMDEYTKPGIQRTPLTEICLRSKVASPEMSIEGFLNQTLDPPPDENIQTGIANLMQIGALDRNETVTRFGEIAAKFAVDVRFVKALLISLILKCYDPVMKVAAMASVKPPFMLGTSQEFRTKLNDIKRKFSKNAASSDIQFLWNIYDAVYSLQSPVYKKFEFCNENLLSYSTLVDAKLLAEKIKKDFKSAGFLHTQSGFGYGSVNVNQNNFDLVHACFAAAFYPNTSFIGRQNGIYSIESMQMEKLVPDFSSNIAHAKLNASFENWLVYLQKTRSERSRIVRVSTAAIISPLTVLLFVGSDMKTNHTENGSSVVIDGLIEFVVDREVCELLSQARERINNHFDQLLDYPETYGMAHEFGRELEERLREILRVNQSK